MSREGETVQARYCLRILFSLRYNGDLIDAIETRSKCGGMKLPRDAWADGDLVVLQKLKVRRHLRFQRTLPSFVSSISIP
jgi:hypothetical protein